MPPNNFGFYWNNNGNNRRQNRQNNQNMNMPFNNMQQSPNLNNNGYNQGMTRMPRNMNNRLFNNMQGNMPPQMPNNPMMNPQNQMMPPNNMQNHPQGNMPAQMPMPGQLPDLNQLPVFEPLAGEMPLNNNNPTPIPGMPISYEALDEKTMEEVRRIINEKRTAEGQPALTDSQLPSSSVEQTPYEADEKLSEFIQNERNAAMFYRYLSSVASKDEYTQILEGISIECSKRSEDLNEIYKNMYGVNYEIKKSKINNSVKFKEGLNWAIHVENKSLREISDYYAKMSNDTYSRKISSVIYKKICDLNYLQNIYVNAKGLF